MSKELKKEIDELKILVIKKLKKYYGEEKDESVIFLEAADIKIMKEILEINNLEMIKIEDIKKNLGKCEKKLSF